MRKNVICDNIVEERNAHPKRKKARTKRSLTSSEDEIEDVFHEWANMTGFLWALGSVWLPVKNRPGQHRIPAGSRRTSMEPVSSDLHYCPVTQFIGDCLKYLVCQNEKFGLKIQRHIQDLLGHELNPLCYPILFDQIKIQVDKFFDANGQVICSEQNTQFSNQLQQKEQSLRKSTIVAISNLLAANVESGLMRSIDLAEHRDPQTRAAFMEVLTQILQQGTEFDTLAETVLADRFERLLELVTMIGDNGVLPITMALANVVSPQYMDELARVFVTIFDAKHLLHQWLTNMFAKEVEMADCYQTILRVNGLPTKIMSFCFKLYGSHYLSNLFAPILAKMFIADLRSYEVDPSRIEQHE